MNIKYNTERVLGTVKVYGNPGEGAHEVDTPHFSIAASLAESHFICCRPKLSQHCWVPSTGAYFGHLSLG